MHVTTTAGHKDRTIEIGLTYEDGARMFPDWEDRGTHLQIQTLMKAVDILAVEYAEGEGWISHEFAEQRRREIATR